MTIHVSIDEAESRLSELVAAAVGGEDVVLAEAGRPLVRLAPLQQASERSREELAARRLSAFGMWKDLGIDPDAALGPSMTDEELEERWNRKFGPAA